MHSSNRRWIALAVLLAIVGGGTGAILGMRDTYRPENVAVIDRPFPSLTLTDLEGHPVSLDTYRGKILLASFIQVGCGHCGAQLSVLEKLREERYGDGELAVVVISTDAPAETAEFFKAFPASFPIWIDPQRRLYKQLGTSNVPAMFLLDEEGILRQTAVGYQSVRNMRGMIRNLFQGG